MGRYMHGRWHDDKMADDHEGYTKDRVGWGTIVFLAMAAAAFAWMTWPEIKCWTRGICG